VAKANAFLLRCGGVSMKQSLVPLVLTSLLLTACASAPTTTDTPVPPATVEPRTVVVDTDMAADDWMAILYLLQRSDVNIAAITVTGAGEAHCEPGTRNALGLVVLAGGEDIPVACGRETPLRGDHTFPEDWRQAVDGLLGLTLPESTNTLSDQTAVELLTSVISSSPQKVILLTLGPLTNVAEALQAAPALVDNLEMVYVMGGAVDVRGNIASSGVGIDNDVAEWNIYVDPYAAKVVLESGAPITLVPLDATNQAPLTPAFYNRVEDNHSSPEASFVFEVLTRMHGFIESGGYYFWDPLTAAILTDGTLADFQTRRLVVVEAEGPESGRTKPAQDGVEVRVAVSVDGPRFEEVFLDTLNGDR
jgi:inosine-uridine nucleoside N-ribohydrolase